MNKTPLFKLHTDNLKKINEQEQELPELQRELQQTLVELDFAKETDIIVYKDLLQKQRELEKRISRRKKEKMSYLTKTSSALVEYMDIVNNPQKITRGTELLKSNNMQKKEVSKKYSSYRSLRSVLDENYAYTEEKTLNEENFCFKCQKYRVNLADDIALMVCPSCNTQVTVTEFYVRPVTTDSSYSDKKEYQRFPHFCNWLDNIQGKSKTVVPDNVIAMVKKEIHRERMDDHLDQLDEFDIRRYLQKHRKKGMDKFYDNCPQILYIVTGTPPLQMTSDMEHNLKLLFMAIQEPFELFKTENRHNFSSYSYIIFRFCQLLGYTTFLPKLKLHKDPKIRHENDATWKKICKYMGGEEKGWKFIKTYDF